MPEHDPTDVGRRCVECGASFLSRLPYRRCPVCKRPPKISGLALIAALALGGAVGTAVAGDGGLFTWLVVSSLTAVAAAFAILELTLR